MRYEILEELEGEGLVSTFSTDYREGALRVAAGIVDCAKYDGYDYLVVLRDEELGEELKRWDALEEKRAAEKSK